MTTKGYDVFKNGKFIGFVSGQNKKTRLETIKELNLGTHMGEWIKRPNGIEYCTTIGVYVLFNPCKRVSSALSNYKLETK
jgi:hypothetical protein